MALIFLEPHHINPVVDCVKKRMEVIKKRLLKDNDWGDYSEDGIITKCCDASDEFYRLSQALEEIRKGLVKQQTANHE